MVQKLGEAVGQTLQAFQVQQAAIAQLSNAVKNNSNLAAGSLQRLISYSSQLQKKGIFGDEEIQKQASYLTSLGLTEQQIKGVLEASAELAASGVMPLESAVKNMAKQFGGMAGELGEKIPALRTLTAEQLKAGEGIALVQKQFAGALETAASTLEGKTQRAANVVGDIKEKIGAIFAVGKMGLLDAIQPALEKIDKWLEENLPKIINFFINLPEIGKITLNTLWNMIKIVFTLDFWINYFTAVGQFVVQLFSSVLKTIWSLVQAIAKTIWEPLRWGFDWVVFGIKELFSGLINAIISGVENAINFLIGGVNKIIGAINAVASFLGKDGDLLGEIGKVDIRIIEGPEKPKEFDSRGIGEAWSTAGKTFLTEAGKVASSYVTTMKDVVEPLSGEAASFFSQVGDVLNRDLPENIKAALNPAVEALATTSEGLSDALTTVGESANPSSSDSGGEEEAKPWKDKMDGFLEVVKSGSDSMGQIITSIVAAGGPIGILFLALQKVLEGVMAVVGPIIDSLLRPLFGILRIVGETLGKMLAPVLMQLSPVIELVSKAFVFLYNYAIRPLANVIIWVISTIYNMIANLVNGVIKALNKIPFVNITWRMQTMDYDSMKLEKIEDSDLDSAGERAGVGYAGGQSASYAGKGDTINNIYIDVETINGTNKEAAIEFWNTLISLSKTGEVQLSI